MSSTSLLCLLMARFVQELVKANDMLLSVAHQKIHPVFWRWVLRVLIVSSAVPTDSSRIKYGNAILFI